MVIFIRWNHSKARIARESTSLWHVQNTQDHSHTPRFTRDMISYPLYFFRLIDRGRKSASGSAPRLPAAAAAAPTGPGMPQTHHLAGPGPPGAARESFRLPNGRSRAGASRAAAGSKLSTRKNDEKAAAPRPERAAAATTASAAMPGVWAVPTVPSAAVPAPLAVPERGIQGSVSALEGGLEGGSGRIGRGKWGPRGGGAPKLTSER